MPLMKHYVVTQSREVEITATNSIDALKLAAIAFEFGQNSDGGVAINNDSALLLHGLEGNSTKLIREINLSIHLDR